LGDVAYTDGVVGHGGGALVDVAGEFVLLVTEIDEEEELGDEGGEFYGASSCGFGICDVGVDVGVVVVAVCHFVGGRGSGSIARVIGKQSSRV
jgi:hypothetical protein